MNDYLAHFLEEVKASIGSIAYSIYTRSNIKRHQSDSVGCTLQGGRGMKYKWPKFHYAGKRALYVRDDNGVMRRVGTFEDERVVYIAGKLYTLQE